MGKRASDIFYCLLFGADGSQMFPFEDALVGAFELLGYKLGDARDDGALCVLVLGCEGTGAWAQVGFSTTSLLRVASPVARAVGESVRAYEVLLDRERVVSAPDGDMGFYTQLSAMAFSATPGVGAEPIDVQIDDDVVCRAHGSADETAGYLVEYLADPPPFVERKTLYFVPQDDGVLDARLRSLVADVRAAGAYSVVEMAGQRMVRFVLPDGSRRMSAVSDHELAELLRVTGRDPS